MTPREIAREREKWWREYGPPGYGMGSTARHAWHYGFHAGLAAAKKTKKRKRVKK